jgi:hypothetical protein
MTVLPFVSPSVTIVSAPGDTVCVASTISFTPSPVFGGAGPTYNWFVNGAAVGTSATYSYTPATGDLVKCVLHSNYGCLTVDTAISNTITVTVLTSVTPAVSIRASRDTVCAGTAVTFTPTATFGGTSPVYRWYVNGSFVATGATYSYLPAAGDVVKCIMYSAMTCATPDSAISNTKTIVVRSGIVPSITITAVPGTTVTYGTTVTFNSVVVNGGTAPTYQWQVNGTNIAGATNSTYVTDSLQHNDVVTCIVTSNDPCASPVTATSNSTTITISNVGVAEVNFANASFTISPNPNTGTFQLLGQVNDVITTLDISVTDMAGKVVYRKQVGVAKGRITELLQPEADLASGMYLLHLNYAGGNTVLHFEIVK